MKSTARNAGNAQATNGTRSHRRDELVRELGARLDSVWRCDHYLAASAGSSDVRRFWCSVREDDKAHLKTLTELLARDVVAGKASAAAPPADRRVPLPAECYFG
ncbi:MAG: hypothetical protein SGJ11_02165 [Phycisphaerae bacterium]|nr:hypothetical protein [Phycisphaerae bacterium]